MQIKRLEDSKGYSLIELIVVLVIIGILVMLAVPKFTEYMEMANIVRIQNDSKILEDAVQIYYIKKDDMEIKVYDDPIKSNYNKEEVIKNLEERVLYTKEGLVDRFDGKEYYIISKLWHDQNGRSSLKGSFIINDNKEVAYVSNKLYGSDDIVCKNNIFTYQVSDSEATIIGFTELYKETLKNDYTDLFPVVSETAVIDGKEYNVIGIDEYAFKDYKFIGKFQAPYLREIGHSAFRYSIFTGEFNNKNIRKIGIGAFLNSQFSGELNLENVEKIENYAFNSSYFDKSFNAPKVRTVGVKAFFSSKFQGDLNAVSVTYIGDDAFGYGEFKGGLNIPNISKIGVRAFDWSQFKTYNPHDIEMISAIKNKKNWSKK